LITLVIHPIDTEKHPTVPPGWRWAVMVGDGPYDDMNRCAEARYNPTEAEADLEGEMVAVAVVKALRIAGLPAGCRTEHLDHDPIPAGGDHISIGG